MSIGGKVVSLFREFMGPAYHKSYAQCGEDLIADYLIRGVLKRTQISYLDIGTNDPVRMNNTYRFYRAGFSGVCVEPNPILCQQIRRHRPRDLCLNIGVSHDGSKLADFHVMEPHTLSSFSSDFIQDVLQNPMYKLIETKPTALLSLTEIIDTYCGRCPTFLSMDVEGIDQYVLDAFDFERHRPEVVCVETVTHVDELKVNAITTRMSEARYCVYADTFINTIYVDEDVWNLRMAKS